MEKQRQIVYSYFMPVWGIVKTAALRCRGQLDALLPEAESEITVLLPNQC